MSYEYIPKKIWPIKPLVIKRRKPRKKQKLAKPRKPPMTTLEKIATRRWEAARKTAQRRSLTFSLTKEDVCRLLRQTHCARTGVLLVLEARHPHSPAIDRIDKSRGYTKDNIQVTSAQYSKAKNKLSDAEFLELCKLVVGSI